jgi:hypothetical protein
MSIITWSIYYESTLTLTVSCSSYLKKQSGNPETAASRRVSRELELPRSTMETNFNNPLKY